MPDKKNSGTRPARIRPMLAALTDCCRSAALHGASSRTDTDSSARGFRVIGHERDASQCIQFRLLSKARCDPVHSSIDTQTTIAGERKRWYVEIGNVPSCPRPARFEDACECGVRPGRSL